MTRRMPQRLVDVERLIAHTPEPVAGDEIAFSREGRSLLGYRLGSGPLTVSLIGGCHADEPVGPWLLDRLVSYLSALPADAAPLARVSWWIVPHANPDGEVPNAAWTSGLGAELAVSAPTPDLAADPHAYATHVVREAPGDDVEFGFPRDADDDDARPETRGIAAWWRSHAGAFHLHVSLHGMGIARGPWYLIEPAWRDRVEPLMVACRRQVAEMGYALHDDARTGEKGFDRLAEGFSTRPDSRAMAAYFEMREDPATASRFRPSSMETIRSLGGDPLTLVTEMPLFLVDERPPGTRAADVVAAGGATPMPIVDQWRLQWGFIEAGLSVVESGAG